MSCPICGFNGFECYTDGVEKCQRCGTPKEKKSCAYIDPADYTVVQGEVYWRRGFNNFNETKILDKQVMIK